MLNGCAGAGATVRNQYIADQDVSAAWNVKMKERNSTSSSRSKGLRDGGAAPSAKRAAAASRGTRRHVGRRKQNRDRSGCTKAG